MVDALTAWLFLTKLAAWALLPLSLAGLALLAVIAWPGVPRGARVATVLALALAWGGGCRLVSDGLAGAIESRTAPLPEDAPPADAIVVLGGGVRPALPPRALPDLTDAGDRVLEATRLWREGRAPRVLACGGNLDGSPPEAADLATLLRFLGVAPEAILEDPRSRTTRENALEAKRVLERVGAHRILLVTSALHMPRAAALFRAQGFDVAEAPTDWVVTLQDPRSGPGRALALLPTAERLGTTTRALREAIALAAARVLGWAA